MNLNFSIVVVSLALLFSFVLVFTSTTNTHAQELNNTMNHQTFGNPDDMTMNDNMSMGSTFGTSEKEHDITSSVSIFQPIINAFKSMIKININDAITSAQDTVGANATTVAAFLHPEKQYIVYNIITLDSSGTIHRVLVDPGNGSVLDDKQVSFMELMKMVHGDGMMGGHDKMMGPEMGMGGMMGGHDKMMGPEMGMGGMMGGHDKMMGPEMGMGGMMGGHDKMMGPEMGMGGMMGGHDNSYGPWN
ncbi:PepSY domain-containing protein [Candidatus Nitrosocosmicus franklandus]|uniref:PepSY domain-containing protein n=1 Tax=Candidatus Nitrosocosmicus franklandianus TaxID=1798806 RepID=A0A484IH48_9ARCH|nr:PepSY domain-containing protein [Candidatus Nitrosocosmicus franklandus]VFJ14246.1 conserved exported protein of unknown function [Candidatus Nitrosocosmicus franklandus]